MDFQLQRLILIDSFSPGRVVIFPLEGGAVLTQSSQLNPQHVDL